MKSVNFCMVQSIRIQFDYNLRSIIKQVDPFVYGMVKAVSSLDKMALNNTHVHHLIYAHWHKVDSVNLMVGFTSILMKVMNLAPFIGWQTSHQIDRQLVCDAFNYAMARQGYPTGVMVHSDQGSQYCSRDFRTLLLTNKCIQSMSRSLAQYTAHVGIMQ